MSEILQQTLRAVHHRKQEPDEFPCCTTRRTLAGFPTSNGRHRRSEHCRQHPAGPPLRLAKLNQHLPNLLHAWRTNACQPGRRPTGNGNKCLPIRLHVNPAAIMHSRRTHKFISVTTCHNAHHEANPPSFRTKNRRQLHHSKSAREPDTGPLTHSPACVKHSICLLQYLRHFHSCNQPQHGTQPHRIHSDVKAIMTNKISFF